MLETGQTRLCQGLQKHCENAAVMRKPSRGFLINFFSKSDTFDDEKRCGYVKKH